MGEHKLFGRYETLFGFDMYNANFVMLMVMTAIEVGAVAQAEVMSHAMLVFVLVSIGVVKFVGIALIFMHLGTEDDSPILTLTALFPVIFIIIMVIFIGLTSPNAPDALPDWCRPPGY